MTEEYVTNPEYETYFQKLSDLRSRIADAHPGCCHRFRIFFTLAF